MMTRLKRLRIFSLGACFPLTIKREMTPRRKAEEHSLKRPASACWKKGPVKQIADSRSDAAQLGSTNLLRHDQTIKDTMRGKRIRAALCEKTLETLLKLNISK